MESLSHVALNLRIAPFRKSWALGGGGEGKSIQILRIILNSKAHTLGHGSDYTYNK